MMVESHIKKSKFLSWALRHNPGKIGLKLDAKGWANVSELIECARNQKIDLSRSILYEIVETDSKGRYELSRDLTKIRAVYGHSIDVDLDLEPNEPPRVLYHGTATRFVQAIFKHGIQPGRRRYVHLSTTHEAAKQVGARHGTPAVLEIDAGLMAEDGLELYQMSKDVWVTCAVPAKYVRIGNNSY
jgi:putative RNA 2'-phosphotransferase